MYMLFIMIVNIAGTTGIWHTCVVPTKYAVLYYNNTGVHMFMKSSLTIFRVKSSRVSKQTMGKQNYR